MSYKSDEDRYLTPPEDQPQDISAEEWQEQKEYWAEFYAKEAETILWNK